MVDLNHVLQFRHVGQPGVLVVEQVLGVLAPCLWGNVCPARARRATFLLTILTSSPDLPSHGEAPQVDHVALHTFPTKHVAS